MARSQGLPNGIEVQGITYGDPGNNLPHFVRDAARVRGYGDSKGPWSMYVHPDDIDRAFQEKAHGNGAACVMAQAGTRLGAQMIYFYRTSAWVDFGSGPIVRYLIPKATYRNVIDPFDRNERTGVLAGMYPLLAPNGETTLKARRLYNQKRKTGKSRGILKKVRRQHSERVILAPKVA